MGRVHHAVPRLGAEAASGYLQERLRFCAAFGARGIFNFGELGPTSSVADVEARAADRRRSIQIGAASAAIGTAVGVMGFLAAREERHATTG